MKAEFWHERWESDQLGFHQTEVNALLVRHWRELDLPPTAPVFVPLCGKSLDMRWLRDVGHPVVGIELSPIAVRDFFTEGGLERTAVSQPPLERSEAGGYTLFTGDLFDLGPEALADVRGVYDRASLIALPPELRRRYANHLIRILPDDVEILMIVLEYDQSKMSGPPHSVSPDEVEALFGDAFAIERLATTGQVEASPRFRERGLDLWCESVLRLRRGAGS